MLVRYKSEEDVLEVVKLLKDQNYNKVQYWPPTHYQAFHINFYAPGINHELNIYIKPGYSSGDCFRFETNGEGIIFDIEVVKNYVDRKLNNKKEKQLRKNVVAVNRPIFNMYVCGQIENLGGEIVTNNGSNINARFRFPNYIVKIYVNNSVGRYHDKDFDDLPIDVNIFRKRFRTTFGEFISSFPNVESLIPQQTGETK